MEAGDAWQLFMLTALLMLSAFFSASETALTSLSKIRIRSMVIGNVPGAKKVQELVENPDQLLGAILVGNNIVNIGASALATSVAIKHFGNTGVGIATGIMTLLVLVFAEITPKSVASRNSERISLRVVNLLALFVIVFKPITIVLMYVTNALIELLVGRSNAQPGVTEEEIKTAVNVGHEEGVLKGEEREMIHNVIDFGQSRVADVMTQRTSMVAIEIDSSYEQVLHMFRKRPFSRIPVYQDSIDNIVGVLFLKDLFLSAIDEEFFDMTKHLKEPYFTIEFKLTTKLFREMRDIGRQMAIVIDEYGGTAGIITIEDLVEEIVGDIHDESDEIVHEVKIVNRDEYVVLGVAKVDLINNVTGTNIHSDDFDSIGGFALGLFGRLPEAGDEVQYNNVTFIVEEVYRNRIHKLRIRTSLHD